MSGGRHPSRTCDICRMLLYPDAGKMEVKFSAWSDHGKAWTTYRVCAPCFRRAQKAIYEIMEEERK